jgi:serine/threonine protein kinase
MNTNMPWLKDEQLAAIRTLMIDRAHAYKADPEAVKPSVYDCLVRYFTATREGQPQNATSHVDVPGTQQTLMRLSAFHMSDVFFDPNKHLARGQQGAFFAGVTRQGYPVGIKCIHEGSKEEAKAMRALQVGGYLQVHYGKPHATPTWVVMPCYTGTLNQLAPMFFEVASQKRSSPQGSLIGARYILRNLLGELAFLHDEMKGVHQDIKSTNIFVSQKQKRFLLGDMGLSSKLSIKGDAPFSGMTFGLASPEQAAENQTITPASDIFSLCVTAVNGILQGDPTIKKMWEKAGFDHPLPTGLFPHQDMPTAFAAWGRFSDHGDSILHTMELLEITSPNHIQASNQKYLKHFSEIAWIMDQADASLWETLRSGLRLNPKKRPTAKKLQECITLSNADQLACEKVWDKMKPYNDKIDKEIKRLTPLIKTLN